MSQETETGIRPYGPGKFSAMLDAYVHFVSMDGTDEETGDVDRGCWHGIMRQHGCDLQTNEAEAAYGPLTDEEKELLDSSVGVILTEDSQGFVDVEYFESVEDIEAAWQAYVDDHSEEEDTDA